MTELPKIKKLIALENGPYIVLLENDKKIALCRCGQSDKAPLCNGAHMKCDFKAEAFEIEDVN